MYGKYTGRKEGLARAFLIAFLAHILCTDHLTKHWPSFSFSRAFHLQWGQTKWRMASFLFWPKLLAVKRNCFLLSSLMVAGCRGGQQKRKGWLKPLIYVFKLVHFFCVCCSLVAFFSAVRPLGFVCAQSTLGHKWNVASAPLGKRKKLIVRCSLLASKNHQAHTYSIKKKEGQHDDEGFFLVCKEKWCSRPPWHSGMKKS